MSTKVASFPALPQAASDGVSQAAAGLSFNGTNQIAANTYTLPLNMEEMDTISLQVSMPSTATGQGTVTLQGTNYPYDSRNPPAAATTPVLGPAQNATWSTIGFWDEATQAWLGSKSLSNAATTFLLTVPVLSCRVFRVLWTNTAGTAPVRMDLTCKSDGH